MTGGNNNLEAGNNQLVNDILDRGSDKIALVIRNYTLKGDKGDKLSADSSINLIADNSIKLFADNSSTPLAGNNPYLLDLDNSSFFDDNPSNLIEDSTIGGLERDWPMTEAGFIEYDDIAQGNSTSIQNSVEEEGDYVVWIVMATSVGCLLILCYVVHWIQVLQLVIRNRKLRTEDKKKTSKVQSDIVSIRALERKTNTYTALRTNQPDEYETFRLDPVITRPSIKPILKPGSRSSSYYSKLAKQDPDSRIITRM